MQRRRQHWRDPAGFRHMRRRQQRRRRRAWERKRRQHLIAFSLLGRAIQWVRVHRGTTILVCARSRPLACLRLARLVPLISAAPCCCGCGRQRQVRPGRGRTCVVVPRNVDWQLGHRRCVRGRQGRPRGAVRRSWAACRQALVCTASIASECARVKDGGHTCVCPAVSSRHATLLPAAASTAKALDGEV
jgi:hypothetical protein